MFSINVSEGKDNWNQLNNKYKSTIVGQHGRTTMQGNCMCNVTSLTTALQYAGWVMPMNPEYDRPADALCDFMIKECKEPTSWFAKKYPVLYNDWYINGASYNPATKKWEEPYWPNEIHDVLAHYANEWLGCSNAVTFKDSVSLREFFRQIYSNRIAVPTSVAWGPIVGHIVVIVGFEAPDEDTLYDWFAGRREDCPITKVIYDDPYNQFVRETQRYDHTKSGNDNVMTFKDFLAQVKTLNKQNKYAHIIAKPASFV